MSDTSAIHQRHRQGFQELNAFWDQLDALETAIDALGDCALSFAQDPIERALEQIHAFEPSVSVIGQVKAGKSTLLNALIGQTDLLPSDVNPWTSVITGIHLNSRHRPIDTRALFRFFDAHEWDRLVATGGRLGEMAARAGFEAEADEVRAQVTEMRQSTQARLGDEFAALLGASHSYPDLDKSLIDRYICYGDPSELEDGATEGVYADLTKSADLYVDLPGLPRGLCLRDTPGVNDTFMMREQITLNAIAESRVCVVVLSAHQALSTMDVALLRIICSVEAREVLIFVNRIDELADPAGETVKIRTALEGTLRRLGLSDDIEILFGSGYWANCALGDVSRMMPASRAALAALHGATDDLDSLRAQAFDASGVSELHRAIARRIVDGPGQAFLNDTKKEIDALLDMTETVESVAHQRSGGANPAITAAALTQRLDTVRDESLETFDEQTDRLRADLHARLLRAQDTFVGSALEALEAHIAAFGEFNSWTHDPANLRMMMKTAFSSSCAKLRREGEAAFDNVLDGMQEIVERDLGVFRDAHSIDFPEQPQHKAPTVLARTLSLDLQGPWWRKFWRFGARGAAEKRYRAVILAETTPLVDDLLTDVFDPAVARTREIIEVFAREQAGYVRAIHECMDAPRETPAAQRLSA
ncbi:dynamin family protein [Tropicibacter naphthalenivorans]|uniref:GTP-binding protein Der n=1 Tax=Tropicibacter naphthalenivorans TaxID=441103 RepID=A0A0N7LYR2_9RHOB|nr:dynamin family protein [Tropicibacter naphthalenivorans]CUH75577.1 GTP-binding protein Der [Tropicibacter naphthalenivorans]SMC43440.1 Dynamin family protein [Tropicibacter naphthalenivorans]